MEGCLHPANLDGYAVIKVSELKDLVGNFHSFKDRIYKSMIYFNDYVLIQLKKILQQKMQFINIYSQIWYGEEI
jgi:hypothetical protein